MSKYEFVPKREYLPVRIELEKILKEVQNIIRDEFTFQFRLVGSGNKHLITREINGNKGFDFDYNLILNHPKSSVGYYWLPKYAKETLMKAFRKVVKGTNYSDPEDSTTSITIKVKDYKNSKIFHSCDFAIIYYPNDEQYDYYKYIRFNKPTNYTWEIRTISKNIDDKLEWLKHNVPNYWTLIKEHYLHLKNTNKDKNKHSFQLYYETINNLYNGYHNLGIRSIYNIYN